MGLMSLTGLLLVGSGLWGDRDRGRARCPKCWYDMRGTVPRLECPECGHDAGQKEQLYCDRALPWQIAIGALLVCFALLALLFMLVVSGLRW